MPAHMEKTFVMALMSVAMVAAFGFGLYLIARPERMRDRQVRSFNKRPFVHRSEFGGLTRVWFPLEAENYLRHLQSDGYILQLRLLGVFFVAFALFFFYTVWTGSN